MVKKLSVQILSQGLHEVTDQIRSIVRESGVREGLTATSLSIPILDGELGLGTWQGIFLWEHRRHASTRRLLVHVGE